MTEPDRREIVIYRPEWREQLLSLWKTCFPNDPPWNEPVDYLEQKLGSQPDWVLLSIQEEQVVGSIVGGYDGVRGWMYHVATHPNFRRRGVARSLVQDLEERLRAIGCVKLNLQIRSGNHDVANFYKALGYEEEPRLSMGKRLV